MASCSSPNTSSGYCAVSPGAAWSNPMASSYSSSSTPNFYQQINGILPRGTSLVYQSSNPGLLGPYPSFLASTNDTKVVCQLCFKAGHSAFQCRLRNKDIQSFNAMTLTEPSEFSGYPDNRASTHITPHEGNLPFLKPYTGTNKVLVGNGTLLPIAHTGHCQLLTQHRPLQRKDVIHVPQLSHNLLFVHKLCTDNSCSFNFNSHGFRVKDNQKGKTLLSTKTPGALYPNFSRFITPSPTALFVVRVPELPPSLVSSSSIRLTISSVSSSVPAIDTAASPLSTSTTPSCISDSSSPITVSTTSFSLANSSLSPPATSQSSSRHPMGTRLQASIRKPKNLLSLAYTISSSIIASALSPEPREIEKNYVGGCLDYFDDCNPIDMKLSVLIHMTNGLGYGTNVGFMYKIPVVNGDFSLRKIEMEDDMVDMAAIGKQNGSVELYITQANNIAFLDSEVGQLGEIAEGDNEDSKGDSGSFDSEKFHDSDYDFCKDDDDDVIYNQSVATAGRDLSIVLGIKEVGHEEQGIEEPEQHEPHEAGQKHKHVKATDACDVNIFHGEQIQVNEEIEFLNSDELNSMYSSSDEEVRPTSRFVLLRPQKDMEEPNLYVGLQFSSKNEFKEAVENFEVKWGKEFRWKKNDSLRMRAICQANNCSWFVLASKMADSDIFVIKTMGPPHQCGRTFYHKRVTSTFLSKTYVEFLRLNRKVTVGEFQEKGLGSAIHEILLRIEHRHYVRHLHNNFKKLHPGDSLKARVWACARSTYRKRFDSEMESLKQYDEEAHKWLTKNTSPYHWSRSYFRTIPKCDILLNNLCETFNSVILETREKPILGMLENIRMYLMERLGTKREWIRKRTQNLCPKIQKKLEKAKEDASFNIAGFSNDSKFEVTHMYMYGEKFAVDLEKRVCDCRRWELTGIPCSHAVCCISLTGEEPESFVNQWYSKDAYVRAYEPAVQPINGPNAWPNSKKDPIHTPKKLKLPGRPKKARKREPNEQINDPKGIKKLSRVGITHMTCSGCHQKGHTARKCPQRLTKEAEMQHMQAGESNVQAEESNVQAERTSILPEVQVTQE
ncbi:hypothetical protein ACH5RR_037574 [Cinchona calisaya]|uniref:SWIM-type domain-containing protein n=1 Tax=Cinchona calisaya TaxID=153742 RepID=A0ABD2YBB8_9GENT